MNFPSGCKFVTVIGAVKSEQKCAPDQRKFTNTSIRRTRRRADAQFEELSICRTLRGSRRRRRRRWRRRSRWRRLGFRLGLLVRRRRWRRRGRRRRRCFGFAAGLLGSFGGEILLLSFSVSRHHDNVAFLLHAILHGVGRSGLAVFGAHVTGADAPMYFAPADEAILVELLGDRWIAHVPAVSADIGVARRHRHRTRGERKPCGHQDHKPQRHPPNGQISLQPSTRNLLEATPGIEPG